MKLDALFNVMGAIVTVALVSVIVTGKNTAPVIKAGGGAFADAIKAAKA